MTYFYSALSRKPNYVVLDTETNGLRPFNGDRVIGLAVYFPETDYPPMYFSVDETNLEPLIRGLLSVPTWVMFNAKFDMHMLRQSYPNIKIEPDFLEDVMLAAHLLNENEALSNDNKRSGAYTLKRLAKKYLGDWATLDEDNLKAKAKELGLDPKRELYKLPIEVVAPYAMQDVKITWYLRDRFMNGLFKWNLRELYKQRCVFLYKVLLRMEENGLYVNPATIANHVEEIGPNLLAIQAEFTTACADMGINLSGDDALVNLRSPMQVRQFFGLRGTDLPSTDKFSLRGMRDPLANLLLQYRTLSKAETTYYAPYQELADPYGFIHPNLNAIGTVSGRLSSDNPNFQNIPRGNEKYKVKQVFEPRPGYALFQCDYKQLELRLAVHFAQEEIMRRMFLEGTDLHQYTADQLGTTRYIGKTANFGLLYGMGAKKAALMFDIDEKDARRIVEGWHKVYPAFRRASSFWQEAAQEWKPAPDGTGNYQYITLFNGRHRHYNEFLKYPEYGQPPYSSAWNFVVQGSAAAIAEDSMLGLCQYFNNNELFKPVLAVHDAILFEVPVDTDKETVDTIESHLTDWPQFSPPMAVDTSVTGTTWYDMRGVQWDKNQRLIL